jgi:hypothetical protein
MTAKAESLSMAQQARRLFVDDLVAGMPSLVAIINAASAVIENPPPKNRPGYRVLREEAQFMLNKHGGAWHDAMIKAFSKALRPGQMLTQMAALQDTGQGLALLEESAHELEVMGARLAASIQEKTQGEYQDLRARIGHLEDREDLDKHDILRTDTIGKLIANAWHRAGMTKATWSEVDAELKREFGTLVQEGFHEVNRYLVERGVMPQVVLRPIVRRARASFDTTSGGAFTRSDAAGASGEETRMMTRAAAVQRLADNAEVVISKLNTLVGKQVPGFASTQMDKPREVSPALQQAMAKSRHDGNSTIPDNADGPAIAQALAQRKSALKEAATTQLERATIEIVALMFQAILTEERLPAALRVWFARLQMPVLRVAVGEPDFFAANDHPARRLIDRMGACVMGFSGATASIGDALDKEIKRIVQVIEAYPDTGRRVFSTVLTEFERFLEHYFQSENEASKKGVSLAQQVEQRETLAIQYTIEMRKMLNEVPVQEGIRNFLFHVWADVLALSAVKNGPQSAATKSLRLAAADLIWSAGAKVSREERAEVIRRLPPLLKTLRDGMASAGHSADKQDQQIKALNESLAAAFSARSAAIPAARFDQIRDNLEQLEEMLPDSLDGIELDSQMMIDLSGQETGDMEVVQAGGSMPTPAMIQWARELQVGSWYMLDYNDRHEPVQLAWTGMRRHLSLFVSSDGRCVLFQQPRLAAFLQAGLIVPAQEESLTTKATRAAIQKIDADPRRLLG